MPRKFFTSESVTEGHPDKVADQISDAVLDALIAKDPHARVAAETCVSTGLALIVGEISTSAYADIAKVARETIEKIGYADGAQGFAAGSIAVLTSIDEQSPDIAMGVNKSFEAKHGAADEMEIGAGDQGIIFGYATNETDEYMPPAIYFAHKLTKKLAEVRKSGLIPYLRPDGKSQVTVEFGAGGRLERIEAVVVSAQHNPDVSQEQIHKDVMESVVRAALPGGLLDKDTKFFINPTGRFVIGGPNGDSGLTGRKLIVDTYGGAGRHGGGSFSGKDPTKVDRSASYAARHAAKNIVAAGAADKLEIQLGYAIGVANPVSVSVDTFGTGKFPDEKIEAAVKSVFDLRPRAIIKRLDLLRPIYRQTASYGHFGRNDADFPWERLDMTEAVKEALGGK
jgi:S-adenosylmethionine synthetase